MGITSTLPNLKDKPYGGAWSIHDKETVNFVSLHTDAFMPVNIPNFLQDYAHWMKQNHTIHGIDNYKHLAFANGTTEVFDKFYMQNLDRRLRLWKGEYFYHQIVARENFYNNYSWITDDDIHVGDVVVVSLPFANNGTIPTDFDIIMQKCCDKNVPVLIDMAYINISKPIEVNLDYECIKVIATSLSKVFPVETYRIGIRMMKDYLDDSLQAYVDQATPYVNNLSIHVGHELIKKYSNDYIVNKYTPIQQQYCKDLEVTPSDCVIFGIDTNNKFVEYNRGTSTSRLCFSKIWDGRV
jgi:histidinol-phosphate/aromatic aminotransferase/cobyric acid decarboxylase-like protein